MNTHNIMCDFGRHNGERYTRIPANYLKWMVNSGHQKQDIAKAELKRRGTTTPTLEISGHAIDSASLRYRWLWHETALSKNEGLNSWLIRISEKCIKENTDKFNKMTLVFAKDGCWPVLKTVK